MRRRILLSVVAGAIGTASAGCLDAIDTGDNNEEDATNAVEGFYDGVVDDDEAQIEANYWGDIDRVRQEAGVGIHPLGVDYGEVTAVDLQTIEGHSLEEFLSFRTGQSGDQLEDELERWGEGMPTYLDEVGADEYQLIYVEADIEVFGETELETEYLFVIESDGEWYVVAMPSTEDVSLFDIGMQAMAFEPEHLTVEVGREVVWRNTAARAHTVTAVSVPEGAAYFASGGSASYEDAEAAYHDDFIGSLDPGDEYSHTFAVPGTYEYESIPFAGEATGTIVVEE